jgi:hypothetical protein
MKDLFTKDGMLRISMQFFAESDGTGGGDAGNTPTSGDAGGAQNTPNTSTSGTDDGKKLGTDDLDKLIQSRVDKAIAEMGKKNAALQKENDKLKKDKLTADELKQYELSEKEKELAELEKKLNDRENRIAAIKAIKEAGFEDVNGNTLELVDFVMGENEEAIQNKVKAFKELVDKFVRAEVDKTFKKNGRTPNSGNVNGGSTEKNNAVAERLGAAAAEKSKQSSDIINLYTGGK